MLICKDCFIDEELRSEINANASTDGICEVCGREGKVIDFSEYRSFFMALLQMFSPTNNSTQTIVDIIQNEWRLFKNNDIAKVLLTEVMATFDCGYTIDAFVNYTEEIQERIAIWERLKTSVKEESRFFTNMDEFVQYDYLQCGDNGLKIGDKLYRSRITPVGQEIVNCESMGCPPKASATAGRANPIGIPYLYLSDTAKTTYYEVRAVYLDKLSVGTFEIVRDLKIVDFVHNVSLYDLYHDVTPFEEAIIKKKVIDAISADLSKPLRRFDSELEYVPTQLICEFCRRVVCADGITFESALHKGARNYVLFDETSAKCIEVNSHEITKIDIDRK